MLSRRDLLRIAGQTYVASHLPAMDLSAPSRALRCINVVNFIREIEPRFEMDMMLPIREQMRLIRQHNLPATWLLQFDALVSGPFVPFLKEHMAEDHEVGFWFEMNERHCKAAGVEWRGRPGYEWDHIPSVAFTIGYTPEERVKLADTAMREFKRVWGRTPKSVASWNLDAFTMAHLTDRYGIDAYAVCRDQIATDGFTIWGAPIAGYYPSRESCWSPALDRKEQIATPVFRMLGQDPVYYYDCEWKLPDDRILREPDTMEPVWTSGRSPRFVRDFLAMIADAPTGRFAYAQLGQENTFPWPQQAEGYPPQMETLAALREKGEVHVETMGETGLRFKRAFKETPVQTQVQLSDPFGNTAPAETSVWYQSRFYRANLHFKGDLPYLRDLMVYSDRHPQPFLRQATRDHEVEQRALAILDGYHWAKAAEKPGAGAFFEVAGERLRLSGMPKIQEKGDTLIAELPIGKGRVLQLKFEEKRLTCRLTPENAPPLALSFEWEVEKAASVEITPERVDYKWQAFPYAVILREGRAQGSENGWKATSEKQGIVLDLAQKA